MTEAEEKREGSAAGRLLSSATAEAAAALRCECPNEGVLAAPASWYDAETELPFLVHAPGNCQCTNELTRYIRRGVPLMLCSCCHLPGDLAVGIGA